jgi:two-component system response regulator NreC
MERKPQKEAALNIRVMVVDDHTIMREGLRSLIEKEAGMAVCGEAADGLSAIGLARVIRPDLIVMDLTMPGLNGIEAIRHILADCPGIKVLALSMHSDRRFADGAVKAGASGYLLKDCAFEELVRAINVLMAGQTYFAAGIRGGTSL